MEEDLDISRLLQRRVPWSEPAVEEEDEIDIDTMNEISGDTKNTLVGTLLEDNLISQETADFILDKLVCRWEEELDDDGDEVNVLHIYRKSNSDVKGKDILEQMKMMQERIESLEKELQVRKGLDLTGE